METICSQGGHDALTRLGCFVYDFQTLITGLLAIGVGIIAGIPVWRQLKDTNLQTRISHRETLATLLRDALSRFSKVDQAIREPLSKGFRATYGSDGEPMEINPHDAHYLEQAFHGVLDWYLVVLADTEHADIEARKSALKGELDRLCDTLSDAHWADHNDQQDEDHDFSDQAWAEILARCAEAKIEAADRVSDVQQAYGELQAAQQAWVRSLRTQIARLDQKITSAN